MLPTGNNSDAPGPVAERIWGRYGSSPGLISLEMSARLARRLTSPGGTDHLPLLNDVYRRWAPGEVSRSYPGPGMPLVWLSPFSGAAPGPTQTSQPSAGARAPHPRVITPANQSSGTYWSGIQPHSPRLSLKSRQQASSGRAHTTAGLIARSRSSNRGNVQPEPPGSNMLGNLAPTILERHQRQHPLSRNLQPVGARHAVPLLLNKVTALATASPVASPANTNPQPILPQPAIGGTALRRSLPTGEPQPLGEAPSTEVPEGYWSSPGLNIMERYSSFPAVARAIERAGASSASLRPEAPRTPIAVQGDLPSTSVTQGLARTNQGLSKVLETTRSPLMVRQTRHERTSGRPVSGKLGLSITEGIRTNSPSEPHQSENDQITNRNQPVQASTKRAGEKSDSPPWEGGVRGGSLTPPNLPFIRGGTYYTSPESASTPQDNLSPETWPIRPSLNRASDLGSSILERQGKFRPLGRDAQLVFNATGSNAGATSPGILRFASPIPSTGTIQLGATAPTTPTGPSPGSASIDSPFDYGTIRSGNPQPPAIARAPSYSGETIAGRESNLPLTLAFPSEPGILNRAFSSSDRPSPSQPNLPLIQMSGAGIRRAVTNNQAPALSAGSPIAMPLQRPSARAIAATPGTMATTTPVRRQPEPANGVPPGSLPASNPEGIDLERLADRVYTIIEQRLTLERESLGL